MPSSTAPAHRRATASASWALHVFGDASPLLPLGFVKISGVYPSFAIFSTIAHFSAFRLSGSQ